MRKCENPTCDVRFEPVGRQKYCTRQCCADHYHQRTFKQAYPGVTKSTAGDIGELRVGVDLLAKGHDVFKSLSVNGEIDLIVAVNGLLRTVQVKIGHRSATGELRFPKPKSKTDIVAVVLADEIIYLPNL